MDAHNWQMMFYLDPGVDGKFMSARLLVVLPVVYFLYTILDIQAP